GGGTQAEARRRKCWPGRNPGKGEGRRMAAASAALRVEPDRPIPDELLVERIRGGDQAAFEDLYGRYFARVHHFVARRMRNRADADETVQEVFVNVFASIDSFRGEAPFGAWLFGLTRRTVASRFKKRMPTLVSLGDDEMDGSLQASTR